MTGSMASTSGIAITDARISNFRSLKDIEVRLGDLTVLMGLTTPEKPVFWTHFMLPLELGENSLVKMLTSPISCAHSSRLPPGDSSVPLPKTVIYWKYR